MKLFYRKIGEGKPVVILHGLFGQSDNWNSFGKQLKEAGHAVYLVDARNHGLSPHSDEWNYQVMSDDVYELLNTEIKEEKIVLIGHSMGGKTAMQFAVDHPEVVEKLVVVDIAPKFYRPHHQEILKALNSIDVTLLQNRKEANVIVSKYIDDVGTKLFLLKNLYRTDDNPKSYNWRFNLAVISSQIDNVGEAILEGSAANVPTLFVKGGNSNYILEEDTELINGIFSNNSIVTIANAGHWLHAEKPNEFYEKIMAFIN